MSFWSYYSKYTASCNFCKISFNSVLNLIFTQLLKMFYLHLHLSPSPYSGMFQLQEKLTLLPPAISWKTRCALQNKSIITWTSSGRAGLQGAPANQRLCFVASHSMIHTGTWLTDTVSDSRCVNVSEAESCLLRSLSFLHLWTYSPAPRTRALWRSPSPVHKRGNAAALSLSHRPLPAETR